MDIREATRDDAEAIRRIAERSLQASYPLSPATIEAAVETWYGDEAFSEKVEREDTLVLIAERGRDDERRGAVGFTESAFAEADGEADLLWLHVHPEYRDLGIGAALFEQTRERLEDRGVERIRGRVLADNAAGNRFYEHYGFEKVGQATVEIGDERYAENVYVDPASTEMRSLATPNGGTVYVDTDNAEVGSVGAFYVVYESPDAESRYGYFCSNCESVATAMDTMGRIECSECGNTRRPTRWDSAYL